MILAATSTCLKMDLAVSFRTFARSPWEIATSPMLLSACMASRIAGRPTSKRSISSRSEGMSSPGCSSPLTISFFRRRKTSSESLRRTIGSEWFMPRCPRPSSSTTLQSRAQDQTASRRP